MARIFWDTNLFIYLFEDNAVFGERVQRLRRRMIERGDELCTSWLTLGELLTKPRSEGNAILEKRYRLAFRAPAIRMLPFDETAALAYSDIRRTNRIRPADAMQLACASVAKADLFITNDERLLRLSVPGVTFITSIDGAPL